MIIDSSHPAHIDNNTDDGERAKFEVPKAEWWNRNGQFKTLHQINPLRLNFINERSPLSGKKVCDVGCGGGILSEAMTKAGAYVTGVDISEDILDVARSHAKESNLEIDYRCIAVEELALASQGQWDIVTCMEALEHVPDPETMIKHCAKLLKLGGSAYFSTLNRNLKSFMQAIVGAEYILGLLPKGTHDYSKFIRPYELLMWCDKYSLNLVDIKGITYNPILNRYYLVKSVDVNYIAHATLCETAR